MIALAFVAGAAYAVALWFLAVTVARQRGLELGRCPGWVIALSASAAVGCGAVMPHDAALLAASTLIGALVCAIVDARTGFIFDALSLSMILIAGAIGIHAGRVVDGALAVAVIGGLLGSLYLLTGRRGIGLGDVKLGSAIALGSGLGAGTVAIGSAFVLGAAYALILIALGRARRTDTLRFGPFLAGGAAVGVTFGIVGWPW